MTSIIIAFLLSLSCFFPFALHAQVKYDSNWFLATGSGANQEYGLTKINFEENPPTTVKISGNNVDIDFSNSSWSDAAGNWAYFANGCAIINTSYSLMENGDSINPGNFHNEYCQTGYVISQGTIILPKSDIDTIQYLFHMWADDFPVWGGAVLKLLFTEINSTSNNGLGKVLLKNQILLEDTLSFGQLTATKHANGKDWWLLAPENSSNGYYVIRLDENGPALDHKQFIGTIQDGRDWGGQAVFSPDGRFYVRAEGHSGMEVFEFDRCKGNLYNDRHIELPFDDDSFVGVAISPNSHYLYVSANTVLVQYDLLAVDIASTMDTIGIYDGFQSWLPTTFYLMQLASDGKIYMTTANGTNVMHVIQQPDLAGLACQFEQHAFQLPRYYSFAPPNFPNYRLGPAPIEYCDSLLLTVKSNEELRAEWKIYPNPAQEVITVEIFGGNTCRKITVINSLGQIMPLFQLHVDENTIKIPTANWPQGLYHVVLEFQNNKYNSKKVLILKH